MPKPPLSLQTTSLWDYPSQDYTDEGQGTADYRGATPSYVIWNLLQRYTRPGDLVVDPMAGSGTTVDVARDLGRRALGYDLQPHHPGVFRADARKLPLEDAKADFAFLDPPYGDHLTYSGRPECLGELAADTEAYYRGMGEVFAELDRVLKPGRYLALYVGDSAKKGLPFAPIGARLLGLLAERFVVVDDIAVVRHNASLKRGAWHVAAIEGNFFLRGYHHLYVVFKPAPAARDAQKLPDRRVPDEREAQLQGRKPARDDADGPRPTPRPGPRSRRH
jgi:DNA modification methylase